MEGFKLIKTKFGDNKQIIGVQFCGKNDYNLFIIEAKKVYKIQEDLNVNIFSNDFIINEEIFTSYVAQCIFNNDFVLDIKLDDTNNFFNSTSQFLPEVISYINKLKTLDANGCYNFIQSSYWKKKISNSIEDNVLCLPRFIYFDEFEFANVLGSHAGLQKLGSVYIKMPCIPEYLQSKLSHIFVAMLLFSEDRKKFGNTIAFNALVNELNFLQQTGIELNNKIVYRGRNITKIKIIPSLILGDNLGLNMILGFSESFSSNFYCRICKQHRNITQTETHLNTDMLRNPENYERDFAINDVKLTGVKENSVWNNLKNFHVTENYSVDVMHDLLEGVCHYVLIFILKRFIEDYKFFSTEQLNYRMLTFNYGPIYGKNKPPILNSDFLKKQKLKILASEMLTLLKCFGLIIGDLVPNCEEWSLYLLLRQIVHIVCESDSIQSNIKEHLQELVRLVSQIVKIEIKTKIS
ncbi:hypothetical protein CVS40_6741 [Lucilia cuprina]|nr:hypothetical protein CVS40_6741 [Lucilia cuprina]